MTFKPLSAAVRTLRRQGIASAVSKASRRLRIAVDRGALTVLQWRFGFAPWHSQSPLSSRPYRRGLAAMVNDLAPSCVVEVGCGLGSILALVKGEQRVGYDVDSAVIRAARFLHGPSIDFRVGGFEAVAEPAIDVLIAVNWTHDFDPVQLEAWLMPLLPRTRYLMLDSIDPGEPAYPHHHDFDFLRGRARQIASERLGESNRHFLLFETIR